MIFYLKDGTCIGDANACKKYEEACSDALFTKISPPIQNNEVPQLFTITENMTPTEKKVLVEIMRADSHRCYYFFNPDCYSFDVGTWYYYAEGWGDENQYYEIPKKVADAIKGNKNK